jgi:hypothetical protein
MLPIQCALVLGEDWSVPRRIRELLALAVHVPLFSNLVSRPTKFRLETASFSFTLSLEGRLNDCRDKIHV